ncbi:MAG: hypothetical protein MHM6MM_004462 [Cercozoa sp. M6MM]
MPTDSGTRDTVTAGAESCDTHGHDQRQTVYLEVSSNKARRNSIQWREPPSELVTPTGSLIVVVLNGVNGILGAGVLSLPYAFSKCGLILGIVCLSFVTAVVSVTSTYLVDAARVHAVSTPNTGARAFPSYSDIARRTLGPFGAVVAPIAAFLFSYGGMVSYHVLLTKSWQALLLAWTGQRFSSFSVSIVIGVLLLLFSARKDIGSIAKLSSTNTVLTYLVCAFIVIRPLCGHFTDLSFRAVPLFPTKPAEVAIGVGLMSNAVVFHNFVLPLLRTIPPHKRSYANMRRVCLSVAIAVGALDMVLGFSGLLSFGLDVSDFVFDNFVSDPFTQVMQSLFAVTLVLSYAMLAVACRRLLFDTSESVTGNKVLCTRWWQHVLLPTLAIVCVSTLVAALEFSLCAEVSRALSLHLYCHASYF